MATSTPRVVIIGAGFGGLEAAKALANTELAVTLIDRSNHHLFQPLLYQVATAGLSPAEIAIPIRSVLRRAVNVRVVMAEVVRVDPDRREVELDDGDRVPFDHLIVAAGAKASYFGKDHWQAFATPLKTVDDATQIRRDVLLAFERADRLEDPAHRRRELSFVVIGGGPTGVELAGALAELTQRVLASDFRRVCASEPRVVLIEGADRLLNGMGKASSAEAKAALESMGVEVRLGKLASEIDERGVKLGDEWIEAETIVWAAGVAASPLGAALVAGLESARPPVDRDGAGPTEDRAGPTGDRAGPSVDRSGRLAVEPDCSLPGHPHIFAIGDIAAYRTPDGSLLPGVSPVAMQQGRYVAKTLLSRLRGEPTAPFSYRDRGTMATIGRNRAVAEIGKVYLTGLSAWLAWLFVHLWYLVGFKNRIFVLLQWIFSYVFYRRGSRLITKVDGPKEASRRGRRLREAGQLDSPASAPPPEAKAERLAEL